MKKIMTIVALSAFAAGAMAQEEIQGNIVGYAKINLATSKAFVGAMFNDITRLGVAVNDLDVHSIKTDASGWDYQVLLSWWTGFGFETAYWGYAEPDYTIATWVDGDLFPVTKTFALGEGFMVDDGNGVEFTLAGGLLTSSPNDAVEVTVTASKQFIVNPMPDVNGVDIHSIKADASGWDYQVLLSWWTGFGFETAYWGYAEPDYTVATWVDGDLFPVTKTFALGEAFMVDDGNGVTLSFPNPLPPTP